MRKSISLFLVLFCAFALSVSAQTTADTLKNYAGKWVGTYTGDVSGTCEITLSSGTDGRLTGQVAVKSSEGESYTIAFKSVAVQGSTFKADYIVPNSNGVQVSMEATRSDEKLKGSWQVIAGDGKGTWDVTKAK